MNRFFVTIVGIWINMTKLSLGGDVGNFSRRAELVVPKAAITSTTSATEPWVPMSPMPLIPSEETVIEGEFYPLANDEDYSYIKDYNSLPDDDTVKMFILEYSSETHRRILANQLSYCPYTPLCTFNLNASIPIFARPCCWHCECYENCAELQTCCPDILQNTEIPIDDVIMKSCIPLHLNTKNKKYIFAAYGIDTCYKNAKLTDKMKCTQSYDRADISIAEIVPVIHTETGTMYRNEYCAVCNGVNPETLTYLEAKLSCKENAGGWNLNSQADLINYVLSGWDCNIGYEFESYSLDFCTSSISACNITGNWIQYDPFYETACQLYKSEIETEDGSLYKNVFCALCNGHSYVPRICAPFFDIPSPPYSFSALLSYNKRDQNVAERTCEPGFLYHVETDVCIGARCSSVRQLVNNECKQFVKDVNTFYYEVQLRLTPGTPINLLESNKNIDNVILSLNESLRWHLLQNKPGLLVCYEDTLFKIDMDFNNELIPDVLQINVLNYFVRLIFEISRHHNPEDILFRLIEMKTLHVSEEWDNVHTFRVDIVNGYEKEFELSDSFLQSYAKPDYSFEQFLSKFKIKSQVGNKILIAPMEKHPTIAFCMISTQPIPVNSLHTCPFVSVSNTLYPWVFDDNGITFNETGYSVNHNQFFSQSGNESLIYLCADQFFQISSGSSPRTPLISVETIISTICIALSVTCLLLTLSTYIFFRQLRSLPGRNNMALVVSLLVAQVVYLVGSFGRLELNSAACKLVGILTHFFWLLVMFWMNICTYHMYHVLTRTRSMHNRSGNKRYYMYHLYCFMSSAVFVVINLTVSSVSSEIPGIGYGDTLCYISSPDMMLYTFGVPIAIVVVSNILMFLAVIITIKRTSAVQRNVQNERSDIAVFARLSTLTGITWLFGLIYMWTNSVVFSYLFIVLNAGQGIFLMFSFICNTRVLNMFRKIFSQESNLSKDISLKQTTCTDVSSRD